MNKFPFRNKETSYIYEWIDDVTFQFDFGGGEFVDEEGNNYFIHCEYHLDTGKFIFEVWWEDEKQGANEAFISHDEREYIKGFIAVIANK